MRLYLASNSAAALQQELAKWTECTTLTRVSKGEGGKRENPQKLPQSLTTVRWWTLIPWTLIPTEYACMQWTSVDFFDFRVLSP